MMKRNPYKIQVDIFLYLKELNLRSLFWLLSNQIRNKYTYFYNYPFVFFLQFEQAINEIGLIKEHELDDVLRIDFVRYRKNTDVERYFKEFDKTLYDNNPFAPQQFNRTSLFLKSREKDIYTIEALKEYVSLTKNRKALKELRIGNHHNKKTIKKRCVLEFKIRSIVSTLLKLDEKINDIKTGTDSVWCSQKLLFGPEQLKLFEIPPQKIQYRLNEIDRLQIHTKQLERLKHDLENDYLTILSS